MKVSESMIIPEIKRTELAFDQDIDEAMSTLLKQVEATVLRTIKVLDDNCYTLGFAESCTGGLLSSLLTRHSGVSSLFWGSVVSYANESKSLFLDVDQSVFKDHGAVSAQCALAMSQGLYNKMQSTYGKTSQKKVIAVSITGIAGPNGGSQQKPVGTVFISVTGTDKADSNKTSSQIFHHEFVVSKFEKDSKKSLSSSITTQRQVIQYMAALNAMLSVEQLVNN